MPFVYRYVFTVLWLSWALYWVVAARTVKKTERQEPLRSRLGSLFPLSLAAYLFSTEQMPWSALDDRVFPWTPWVFDAAALMTAAGLAFAVWARRYLGRNWSGTVAIKADHELVSGGPYALVRHPIYTGLFVALIGSSLACGEWRGMLALFLAWAGLLSKMRLEERWMIEQFGERYLAYQRRVPAVIPFWK